MVRNHNGIIQNGKNKGKLKKGYRYNGKKTKTGLPIIVKVNTNVNKSKSNFSINENKYMKQTHKKKSIKNQKGGKFIINNESRKKKINIF